MKKNKPLIGLTIDYLDSINIPTMAFYSVYPWYALRKKYSEIIIKLGGVPLLLIPEISLINDYCQQIDGLIITGGDFDLDPVLYNEPIHPKTKLNKERTNFEWRLLQQFYTNGKPILGICGGMQLINVLFGGSLYQHIPDNLPNALNHSQPNPSLPHHLVDITPNSKLQSIVKDSQFYTNTSHHQGIKTLGNNLTVNALASDKMIEGIECSFHNFCMGLQWHPEWEVTNNDTNILKAFINRCIEHTTTKLFLPLDC